MQEALKHILEIQELDMQMIQLMRLKNERQERAWIISMLSSQTLHHQVPVKEAEITRAEKEYPPDGRRTQ